MATTYTWTIDNMSVLQTPQPDFVVRVQWTCTGVNGSNTADFSSTQSFDDVQEESFTPYADLTEAQVLQWVWDDMGETGKSNTEACVNGQIESEINPPATPTTEPLPW